MIAAPRLLAGLIPVPVMGMVAKWTKKTANPIGRGAKIYNKTIEVNIKGHGSLLHFSWHRWRKRRCKRARKCQRSRHQDLNPWCNHGLQCWLHHPKWCTHACP
ncbi:hypothetical protein Hanom_Chr13g01214501 [Helianthus anomalus]